MSQHVRVSIGLVAVLLLVAVPVAQAQEYGESVGDLVLESPGPHNPGDAPSFSGEGFLPGSDVSMTLLANADGAITDMGVVTADAAGAIVGAFVVPLDASDGTYTVSATGVAADGATRILSARIVVVATQEVPEVTTTTEAEISEVTETSAVTTTTEAAVEIPEALPFEGDDDGGSNVGLILAVGALLLLLVGGFLWWRYRSITP